MFFNKERLDNLSDETKAKIIAELLTDYFRKRENERDSIITDALEKVKDDAYYDSIINAYKKRYSFRKNASFLDCSEYSLRVHKKYLLVQIFNYIQNTVN